MKKLLVLSLVLSAVAFGKVVEGTGEGYKGPVKVAVTLDGDKITKVEVLEYKDTRGIFKKASVSITTALVGKTSTEGVDVVAGATLSSEGILNGVKDALTKK
ncbi:MAG: FMN-binding protein [Fusobacteriaceae bacterium]